MTVNYYSYRDALNHYDNTGDVAPLAEWFERFGVDYWNGECYEIDKDKYLYPIYDDTNPVNIAVIGYKVKG